MWRLSVLHQGGAAELDSLHGCCVEITSCMYLAGCSLGGVPHFPCTILNLGVEATWTLADCYVLQGGSRHVPMYLDDSSQLSQGMPLQGNSTAIDGLFAQCCSRSAFDKKAHPGPSAALVTRYLMILRNLDLADEDMDVVSLEAPAAALANSLLSSSQQASAEAADNGSIQALQALVVCM